jgi:hypothetical protein
MPVRLNCGDRKKTAQTLKSGPSWFASVQWTLKRFSISI